MNVSPAKDPKASEACWALYETNETFCVAGDEQDLADALLVERNIVVAEDAADAAEQIAAISAQRKGGVAPMAT